jgi:Tol biopolymer transport system component/DNA-binding winged helix-turn-helix (wHTH) protein
VNSSHLIYNFRGFSLDPDERVLRRGNDAVPLTPKATDLLLALVEQHGHIVEKSRLMERVWPETAVEESNLSQNIYTLRKVLGELDGQQPFIQTVPRRGYRFVAAVEQTPRTPTVVANPASPSAPLPARPFGGHRLPLALGAVVLLSLGWYFGVGPRAGAGAASSSRTDDTFALSGGRVVSATSLPGEERFPALSPDGTQLAFIWNAPDSTSGDRDLYVKALDSGAVVRITHAGDRSYPAWSPDGRFIAFVAGMRTPAGARSRLAIVPVGGGAERTIWQGYQVSGLDWSPDGKHLVVANRGTEAAGPPVLRHLALIASDGSEVRRLTTPAAETAGDYRAAFSPDGQSIAFVREMRGGTDVHVVAATGGESRRLTTGHRRITSVAWLSGGRRLAFSESAPDGLSTTVWTLDPAGGEAERMAATPEPAVDLATDRAGRRLAFTRRVHDTNIRRIDLSGPRRGERALISSARIDQDPAVSPDARRIAFTSSRSGSSEIWMANADGTEPRQLTSLSTASRDPAWSPDGQLIAFASVPPKALRHDIYVINIIGGPARQLVDDAATDTWPFWSRDGRWIYFSSNRTGAWQIWRVPAGGGAPVQVTDAGGLRGSESPDGRFLYYSKDPPAIWRMPVGGGEPALVFTLPAATDWGGDWTLVPTGIYFQVDNVRPSVVRFFNFASRQIEPTVSFAGQSEPGGGFVVSPDEAWLLYSERTYFNVDIMVVDHLR